MKLIQRQCLICDWAQWKQECCILFRNLEYGVLICPSYTITSRSFFAFSYGHYLNTYIVYSELMHRGELKPVMIRNQNIIKRFLMFSSEGWCQVSYPKGTKHFVKRVFSHRHLSEQILLQSRLPVDR